MMSALSAFAVLLSPIIALGIGLGVILFLATFVALIKYFVFGCR